MRKAFTGAQQKRRGLFEQAHGGTLFLDEIGDMDIVAQAKVLRAVQSGEISRVGSEHVIHVDVRVLAATNKDLARAVERDTFREDLYFRLAVFPIRSPALRERIEDIPLLALAFMEQFGRENGVLPKPIDDNVMQALASRKWPGNVRELKNVVERSAILCADRVTIADLPGGPRTSPFEEEAEPAATADTSQPLEALDENAEPARTVDAPPARQAPHPPGVPGEVRAPVHRRHPQDGRLEHLTDGRLSRRRAHEPPQEDPRLPHQAWRRLGRPRAAG